MTDSLSPPTNRMAVALLALGGLFVALYLLAHNLGLTGPIVCGVGSCATVQSSQYAHLGPMPVSAIGVLGYLALLGLALVGLQPRWVANRIVALLLVVGSLAGFLFSGWLTYLEAAVINAWCQWCVISAVIITLIFLACLPELRRLRSSEPE